MNWTSVKTAVKRMFRIPLKVGEMNKQELSGEDNKLRYKLREIGEALASENLPTPPSITPSGDRYLMPMDRRWH